MTRATASSRLLLIVESAPNSSAFSEPCIGEVDRDDVTRREELRRHDRGEPDRAGSNDRDCVTRLHAAVQDSDLEGRRQDVGEEQDVLVGEPCRDLVHRRVGERHASKLGLQSVDRVPEDPATAAGADPVVTLLAEPAASARRDARHEHLVAGLNRRHRSADLDDSADCLVAENRARGHLRHVAFQDVEIRPADRGRVDLDDCIRRVNEDRIGNRLPGPFSRAVIHERFHERLLWSIHVPAAPAPENQGRH